MGLRGERVIFGDALIRLFSEGEEGMWMEGDV